MRELLENGKQHGMMVVCALVMVGALVVYSSGIPLGNLAPFAMLIICPLMHLLMMRGHGSHDAGSQPSCHQSRTVPVEVTTRKDS